MATSLAKKTSPDATKKQLDAVALLRADHNAVAALFAEYKTLRSLTKKKALVTKICVELAVHAQVEEEIFYPAVQKALKDRAMIPKAIVEQQTMKDLISQVEGKEPDGDLFDAKITVLAEYVTHHVKEEHSEMFPKAKATSLDMHMLGARMAARKAELLAAHGAA